MKKNTIEKRKISRECWCLDEAFFKWLEVRLPVYLREADKVINLDYHIINYDGRDYTQRELIKKLIYLIGEYKIHEYGQEAYLRNEICDVWKELLPYMWW